MKPSYAAMQSKLDVADLELILALHRGRTLAGAAERLKVDTSTVFRAIKRIEKDVGEMLFDRGRRGYVATDLGRELAGHAEHIEAQLEQAREAAFNQAAEPSGTLRLTSTDTLLHSVLLPVMARFTAAYPRIDLELHTTTVLANLSQRDADIAIRITQAPPEHLIGVRLGTLRTAVYASQAYLAAQPPGRHYSEMDWIVLDDSLADHPSHVWRRRRYPKLKPRIKVSNLLGVAGAVVHGMGVGVVPLVVLDKHPQAVILDGPLPELDLDVWALAHPDTRHLGRMRAMLDFLRHALDLPG